MSHLLFRRKTVIGAALLLAAAGTVTAQTKADAPQRCIQISRIDHTKVVDNQNILFYMRGGKVYNNHLPHPCSTLSFGRAFKFATSQSQLCSVDIISVIESSTGDEIAGAKCGLGMFVPVSPQPKAHKD